MRTQIVLGITLFASAALGSPYGYEIRGAANLGAPATSTGGALRYAASATVKCPVVFDGRVPVATQPTDLDVPNEIFEHEFVKGANLNFSQIVNFPAIPGARFDGAGFKPFQVTISDASIFNNQTGFRRAETLFKGNSGKAPDPSIEGVMIVHWSVKQDAQKALNRTHEYLTVFHEAGDFSGNQFNFLAGTLIAGVPEGGSDNSPDTWKVLDRTNTQIFSTPILDNVWQNFAIKMDMVENTLQVFASEGGQPLVPVTEPSANDNSGGGQFHCGVLKKPTGNVKDIAKEGFQPAGISEGLTYSGLFVENGANDCISL